MKSIKIVLSGSGSLYPGHAGAIARLAEHGCVFEEMVTTSGGSIVGAGLASGYRPGELLSLIKQTLPSTNKLLDPSIFSLITKWGFIKGDRIQRMLESKLVKTLGSVKIPLHIVTTNLSKGGAHIFSNSTSPAMSLALAVRASISLPGIFVPIKLDDELYIDGGVTANFMIHMFPDANNVIGIRFTSAQAKNRKIRTLLDFITAIVDSMINSNTELRMSKAYDPKIITIDSKYNNLNINMSEAECVKIYREGYEAADTWLQDNRCILNCM